MNKSNQFSFNKSSLVSLQAELARKKEEALNVTQNEFTGSTKKLQIKPHIVQEINVKKNSKCETPKLEEPEKNSESNSAIEAKIKESLLAKSQLYDRLRNGELVCEESDNFLVNFNVENDDGPREEEADYESDPDSEWVTFTDALGRSRTCLRTDLDYYKKLDSQLKVEEVEESKKTPTTEETSKKAVSQEALLWEKRREELRKVWEEEEARLSKKANIHYQDVLFDEARMHGVGYYSFSQDENERAAQQEALKKLREETEKNQKMTVNVRERRNQLMKQRIAAAKRRKRLQMGLPPEADEEDEFTFPDEEPEENPKVKENEVLEQKVDEFLNNMKRSTYVRPWDVGKDGVKTTVLSQHEWNEKLRSKRPAEFAPPTLYNGSAKIEESGSLYFSSKKVKPSKSYNIHGKTPINFESDATEEVEFISTKAANKGAEIPPPLAYDKQIPKKLKKCNIEESIEAGLNYLRNMSSKKSKNLDDRIRQDYS